MDERIKKINAEAASILQDWIIAIDDGVFTPDDLLAEAYGVLIAAIVLGYDPKSLIEDAEKAANNLLAHVEEDENDQLTNTAE